MRFINIIAGGITAILMAGCAGTGSQTVQPMQYTTTKTTKMSMSVSPIMYETYDCEQIAGEAATLSEKTQKLTGLSNSVSTQGSVIVWPAGLTTDSVDEKNAAELGRIKYQFEALEKAAKREECKISFQRPSSEGNTEQRSAHLSVNNKTS